MEGGKEITFLQLVTAKMNVHLQDRTNELLDSITLYLRKLKTQQPAFAYFNHVDELPVSRFVPCYLEPFLRRDFQDRVLDQRLTRL
jgi:hypothetical protein